MASGDDQGDKGVMITVLSACAVLLVALIVLATTVILEQSDRIERAIADWTASKPPAPLPRPLPPPPPVSSNPADWITSDDYPSDSLRFAEEGRVSVRLEMAASGRPTRCVVTASTATPRLEQATCRALMRGANFPARSIPFRFSRSVVWRLPTD